MRPSTLVPLYLHENLRRAALVLWIVGVLFIVVGSLMPRFVPPSAYHMDKILHMIGYACAGGVPFLAFRESRQVYSAALWMIPMGLFLEAAQDFVPTRAAELGDAIANTSGVVLALLLGPLARRIANRWFGVTAKSAG